MREVLKILFPARFAEKGVRPQIISSSDLLDFVMLGDNHHEELLERRLILDPFQDVEAAHSGQFQIEHYDVWQGMLFAVGIRGFALQISDRFFSIADEDDGVGQARKAQGPSKQVFVIGGVIDEQDRVSG